MAYISYLYNEPNITSAGTIASYLSQGVRIWHLRNNLPWIPITDRFYPAEVLAGSKRLLEEGTNANRKLPITLDILHRIRCHLTPNDIKDKVWWTAALMAFFLLLRKSNLALPQPGMRRKCNLPDLMKRPSTLQSPTVRRADISTTADRVWINLMATKTRPSGGGRPVLRLPLPAVPGHPLCPTTALVDLLRDQANRPLDEPLFGWQAPGGEWEPMSHAFFTRRLKQLLVKARIDPKAFSGHSFRRGGATFAFSQAGLPQLYIKAMGDWISDAFLLYCEAQESLRIAGADALSAAVTNSMNEFLRNNPVMAMHLQH